MQTFQIIIYFRPNCCKITKIRNIFNAHLVKNLIFLHLVAFASEVLICMISRSGMFRDNSFVRIAYFFLIGVLFYFDLM